MSAPRYRVVQWATGNIGTRALREVIRHPELELAGVLVYDPAKAGIDATHKLAGEGFRREWPPLIKMDPAIQRRIDGLGGVKK